MRGPLGHSSPDGAIRVLRLRHHRDGEWIMFECNPFGAYGWLEKELGLPVTAALADRFTEDGCLHTPEWREASLSTWRHPYVPAYYPSLDTPPVLCIDPEQRAAWLDAVHSNQTLVTKVQPLPLSHAFRGASVGRRRAEPLPHRCRSHAVAC